MGYIREKKTKEMPLFVTAKIKYIEWEGRFVHYKKPVEHIEVVQFMSDKKQVYCERVNKNKRLSSITIIEQIVRPDGFAKKTELTALTREEREFFTIETFENVFGGCKALAKDSGFDSYYEFVAKANTYKNPTIFINKCKKLHNQREEERIAQRLAYAEKVLEGFDFRKLNNSDIEQFLKDYERELRGFGSPVIPAIKSIKDRSGLNNAYLFAFFTKHRTIENMDRGA